MFVFQVSLNFDPVKEILKIRCQIYILMMKVIILKKIQVTMKTFAPPFFQPFQFEQQKKRVVMRAMRKKRNIFTLQLPIYYIIEQEVSIRMRTLQKRSERNRLSLLQRGGCSFYGQLPNYQSQVFALSTQQMSSSFHSWCS